MADFKILIDMRVHVIGGGLAGTEAAWQIAQAGVPVTLYEMRPHTLRDRKSVV